MFLVLDEYPQSKLQKLITWLKIFIKEGVIHQHWAWVFRNRRVGGSKVRPKNLIEELNRRNIQFLYNDYTQTTPIDTIIVIKDPRALQWAIQQKRAGKIKRLLAGPLVVSFPQESKGIIMSKEIDGLIFASDWYKDFFLSFTDKKPKATHLWFNGVNENFWSPTTEQRSKVLIYKKNPEPELLAHIIKTLTEKNLDYEIIEYGQYSLEQYKQALSQANLCIFLSRSETQGVAMFEAWSMDVPTLHWNPQNLFYLGKFYDGATSCAYLTPQCGEQFKDLDDFNSKLNDTLKNLDSYHPRNFLTANYTQRHSVDQFLNFAESQK